MKKEHKIINTFFYPVINKTHTDYTLFTYLDKIMCFTILFKKYLLQKQGKRNVVYVSFTSSHKLKDYHTFITPDNLFYGLN